MSTLGDQILAPELGLKKYKMSLEHLAITEIMPKKDRSYQKDTGVNLEGLSLIKTGIIGTAK